MSKVELRQVVGEFRDPKGKIRRAGWDMDILLLDGRQIATINRVPGAPIGLLGGVLLTPSQREEVAEAVAKARGGKRPASIDNKVKLPFELLDDAEETDVDDE